MTMDEIQYHQGRKKLGKLEFEKKTRLEKWRH
jgi:hypothetical protein